VSRAGNTRRLRALEGPRTESVPARLRDDLLELERIRNAHVTMVRFAQALAGTVMQPRYVNDGRHDPAPELAARSPSPELPEAAAAPRVAREPPRLEHHTEATLERVLKEPWVSEPLRPACGQILVPAPSEVPRPKGWVDPWGGSEFVFPSYAGVGDEEEG
jgi:hypothetical protein